MRRKPIGIAFDVNETLTVTDPIEGPRLARVGMPRGAIAAWFGAFLRDGIALTAADTYLPWLEVAASSLAPGLTIMHPPLNRVGDRIDGHFVVSEGIGDSISHLGLLKTTKAMGFQSSTGGVRNPETP